MWMKSGMLSNVESSEVCSHWRIYLSPKRIFALYFARIIDASIWLCNMNKGFLSHTNRRLIKLYNKAEMRIENELDVVKIVKHMRELKIIAKNSLLNAFTKFQIEHANNNVINLESEGSTSQSSCDSDLHDQLKNIEDYINTEKLKDTMMNKFNYKLGTDKKKLNLD